MRNTGEEILHLCELSWIKWMNEWMKVSSVFSAMVCFNLEAHSSNLPSPNLLNLIPVFEIERRTWLNCSLLFFPFRSFLSDWMCFIYSCEGVRKRRKKGGRHEEGFSGTSRHDERGLSLLYSPRLSSFQPFEASHQMGMNSRRDTICLFTTTTPLLSILPTHPSILPSLSIYLDSVLYLPAAKSIAHSLAHNGPQWPLTAGQRNESQVQAEH